MNAQHTATSPPQVQKDQRKVTVNIPRRHQRKRVRAPEQQFFMIMLLDLLFLNASFIGALAFAMKMPLSALTANYSTALGYLLLFVNAVAFGVASFSEVFRISEGVRLDLSIKDLFHGSLIYFAIICFVYYPLFYSVFEVHFLFSAFLVFMFSSGLSHYTIRVFNRNVTDDLVYAVIGGQPASIEYVDEVFESAYAKRTVCVGRFGKEDISGVRNLGGFLEIKDFLQSQNTVDKLLYIDSDLSNQEVREIVRICRAQMVEFEVLPKAINFFEKGVQVEQLAHLPIFRRKKEPLCLPKNKILKRAFDIVFSLAVILLVFPWLLPLIALAIRLESRGPIFFKQQRTGYWNKPFTCLKFRSMTVNSDSDNKQAVRSDARITRVGALLRKTSLDEFPQFFNVLIGDMSVVGPRPHMLKHTEDYSKLIDTFMIRHEVKPGITGWAQVNGWRGPTSQVYQMAKRVEFDVNYIENWSFWFDCKCILLTVFNIFKGEKNAF